jgi:hypothetical protein
VAQAIFNEGIRSEVLATLAERLAAAYPGDSEIIDQAVTLAQTIPYDRECTEALTTIAEG